MHIKLYICGSSNVIQRYAFFSTRVQGALAPGTIYNDCGPTYGPPTIVTIYSKVLNKVIYWTITWYIRKHSWVRLNKFRIMVGNNCGIKCKMFEYVHHACHVSFWSRKASRKHSTICERNIGKQLFGVYTCHSTGLGFDVYKN